MRLVSDLHHPNIVRVQRVYEDTDPPAIVLDFVDGENLETFQARLPYVLPEIALLIAIEVLKALEYSHSKGIVHRDLKPENVLIRRDGQVFVTDFGLAKLENGTTITQTNAIVGSLDFMSPEQAAGDRVGPESDLFSLASILYFLTTGTKPFSRSTPSATLQALRESQAEVPQRRNPKISAGFVALIQKGLEKDPSKRYRTATEFRQAAETYLAGLGLVSDLFHLTNWAAAPTAFVLEMLRTASEHLILECEQAMSEEKRAKVLDVLAHLALKAPENPAIERLSNELIQKSRSRFGRYVVVLLALLGAVGAAIWMTIPRSESLATNPISANVPDLNLPMAGESESKNKPLPQVRGGEVRFLVPDGVSVFWDGQPINPKLPLKNQSYGKHSLKMSMPGFDPIESKVEVRPGKPTVVNAN